jgi:polyhydroxyalkanoate synthesis regulator phasin
MAEEGQKRGDPGDAFREGVRAVSGIIGAFKDAIEQTFKDLSDRGDIAPDRAREAARDAMRRAQEAVEDMRTRVDFVTRREFDALKAELAQLRSQVERHMAQGGHAPAAGTAGGKGGKGATGGTGAAAGATEGTPGGAGGSGAGDGSPGL